MNVPLIEGQRYRSLDAEITWAGDCPWTGSYCFGTENGRVLFYKRDGQVASLEFSEMVADEAIDGVAFFQRFIGVSSRSELSFYRLGPDRVFERVLSGPGGAHGVVATPGGQFVAPMGTGGLFCVDFSTTNGPRAWIDHATGVLHNYYSLRYLGRSAGQDVLACAARNDGLLTIRFDKNESRNQIIGLTASDIDFIDVCSLQAPQCPFAVAALCHDRSLIFVKNMLTEENPQTLRFDQFKGVPYSILSAQGHIFVLTSREIVVLPHLGSRYVSGEPLDHPIQYCHKAVRAVDAFVSRDQELMILTDDGVNIFDILKLVNGRSESAGLKGSADIPIWDELLEEPALLTTDWHSLLA
jgi:hypothetical protein